MEARGDRRCGQTSVYKPVFLQVKWRGGTKICALSTRPHYRRRQFLYREFSLIMAGSRRKSGLKIGCQAVFFCIFLQILPYKFKISQNKSFMIFKALQLFLKVLGLIRYRF